MIPLELSQDHCPRGYDGPLSFFEGEYGKAKNFKLLVDTLQMLPSIDDLVKMAGGSNDELRKKLNEKSPLLFPLLQWTLSSNRAHLEAIPKEHRIPGCGDFQFHLVSSSPQKEKAFRERRALMQEKKKKGSMWVWHGSAPGNWHAILRSGLKNLSGTKLMSAGQAYGPGIYSAKTVSTSLGYMGSVNVAWKNAKYIPHRSGLLLIALCELVNEDPNPKDDGYPTLRTHNNDIITIQNEDIISTRFLFVHPDGYNGDRNLKGEDLGDKIPKALRPDE